MKSFTSKKIVYLFSFGLLLHSSFLVSAQEGVQVAEKSKENVFVKELTHAAKWAAVTCLLVGLLSLADSNRALSQNLRISVAAQQNSNEALVQLVRSEREHNAAVQDALRRLVRNGQERDDIMRGELARLVLGGRLHNEALIEAIAKMQHIVTVVPVSLEGMGGSASASNFGGVRL